ncbi:acetyl-CoA acetyltransferase [Nocardia transvalensis]|uniref:propanoyl-CoA C-acyltransferase n=1 Tax=Nocardia transvalensis TaxID=37333 RepID=A0A7W9PL86_9NOCA|nr:Nonspecific lipid-transfer protein [Nocardia transvalensis]MBB5918215.1 acetyl-CoA acetyltransferase [Nocardia transvalensis]
MRRVFVVGVAMTPFVKIGSREWTYPQMVGEAVRGALTDAGITYDRIQRAAVGYVFQPSAAGQRALYDVGLSGIPIVNVNNNCATGSTALMLAREWVSGGLAEVTLAVGFEQMTKEAMAGPATRPAATTVDAHLAVMAGQYEFSQAPMTTQFFGNAAVEHMKRYGTTPEQLARVAVKNHEHSTRNPLAQFQNAYTLEDVLGDRPVHGPLTRSQCSPMSDGAGAAVLASEEFVREHGLESQAVEILAQELVTDDASAFDTGSLIDVVGAPMTRAGARRALETAGIGIGDVDVIELHDCFSINELITYEALGLCGEGESGALIDSGATTYGGDWVVNPSGGLISKGHPLGATGLAQATELSWQLRGLAGDRQVPGARTALAHNLGLGGACMITVYAAPAA